jgi:hypothetical protein
VSLSAVFIFTALIALAIPQILFIVRYGFFSPWRATWQGITLLAQTITLTAIVIFFIFDTLVVGDWYGRDALLIAYLILLALEAWAALWGLVHVQLKNPPVSERQGQGYVPKEDIEHDHV